MIEGKCPICGKTYRIAAVADLPTFPFCSGRCRLIDLGRWIDGGYAIPDAPAPSPPEQSNGPAAEDE
jgi:endogenous inhibitor of DNA gyrase (YacG/DUF329 family)